MFFKTRAIKLDVMVVSPYREQKCTSLRVYLFPGGTIVRFLSWHLTPRYGLKPERALLGELLGKLMKLTLRT